MQQIEIHLIKAAWCYFNSLASVFFCVYGIVVVCKLARESVHGKNLCGPRDTAKAPTEWQRMRQDPPHSHQ